MIINQNRIEAHSASKGILFALLITSATFAQNDKPAVPPIHASHTDLSYYLAPDGSQVPIKTVANWAKRREQILAGMQEVMGPFPHPKSSAPLDVRIEEEHKEDGYLRRKLTYETGDPNSRIHAWLLIPDGSSSTKRPAVLCHHPTNPNGKGCV